MEDVYRFSSALGSSKTEEMIRFGSPSFHLPVPWFIYSHRHSDRERERKGSRKRESGFRALSKERNPKVGGVGRGGDGGVNGPPRLVI